MGGQVRHNGLHTAVQATRVADLINRYRHIAESVTAVEAQLMQEAQANVVIATDKATHSLAVLTVMHPAAAAQAPAALANRAAVA